MTESEQRGHAVAEARTWLGTKFHYEACVKGSGVDCGSLLMSLYGSIGIPIDWNIGCFPRDWGLHTAEERYLEIVERYTHRVDAPGPGDIVLFRLFKNRPFCHGGLVIEWPLVIHACDERKVEYLDVLQSPLGKREMRFMSPWPGI